MGGRPSFTAILKASKAKCERCGTANDLTKNHLPKEEAMNLKIWRSYAGDVTTSFTE